MSIPIALSPPLQVWIDGQQLRRVISARISRGLDQEFAVGEVVCAYPLPTWVRQWQWVAVRMGRTLGGATERLVGYVSGFSFELWPDAITVHVADPLVLCSRFWPSEPIALTGMTDAQIISAVLNEVGFPPSLIAEIHGTGRVISEDTLTWPLAESAMDLIKEVDGMSLGYRTFCGLDGAIHRVYLDTNPSSMSAYDLFEGQDILEGTSEFMLIEPKNSVTVNGAGDVEATAIGTGVGAFRTVPSEPVNYPKIVFSDPDAVHISATDIADWLVGQLNRNIIRGTFSTYRDDRFGMGSTVQVESDHLGLTQNFWVQSVTTEVSELGQFTQQIGAISELSLAENPQAPGMVDPTEVGMPEIESTAPVNPTPPITPPVAGPTAGMTILSIDQERVIIGGVETTIYSLTATDASTPLDAAITSWAWTASGPGVVIASGSEQQFSTAFTSLTGGTIGLMVTDANGHTGTISRALDGGAGIPIKKRKLYAATASAWEVFDGDTWRTFTPADPMLAVGRGPQAGAGTAELSTTDDLASTPLQTTPFTTSNVTAIWLESDVSVDNVVAGAADGRVATSNDAGVTWTVHDGPGSGSAIRRIISSRFTEGQLWVVDDDGVSVSDDNGETWRQIRAGDFTDLLLSHSRNVVATAAGGMERAEPPGEAFTFPGSPTIVAIAPHIRDDSFYAWASDGTTYACDASGSFAMEARQAVPAGAPQIRGSDADGDAVDLVYFATDANLYKSLDGLRSAAGYLTLRTGAHILVAHGEFKGEAAAASRRLYTWGAAIYKSNDDGATWTTIFTPSNLYAANFFEVAGGQDVIIAYEQTGGGADLVTVSTDGGAIFGTVTAPRGGTPTPFDFMLPISAAEWLAFNATEVYKTTNGGSSWSDVSGTYAGNVQLQASASAGKIWSNQVADPGGTGTRMNADGSGVATFARGPYAGSGAANYAISDTLALVAAGAGTVYPLLYLVSGTSPSAITPSGSVDSWTSAASPDGTTICALGISNGGYTGEIWRSTNGGSSWTQVRAATVGLYPQYVFDNALQVAGGDPTRWACLGGVGPNVSANLWTSSDGGVTWTQQADLPDAFPFALRYFGT